MDDKISDLSLPEKISFFDTNVKTNIEKTSEDLMSIFGENTIYYKLNGENIGYIRYGGNKIGFIKSYKKGFGYCMLRHFIKNSSESTIVIERPLMDVRKFWFKSLRRLKKEGIIKKLKFNRLELRKFIKNIPLSKINHAFSNIVIQK